LLFTVCSVLPEVEFAVLTPPEAGLNPTPIGTVATYSCDISYYVESTGVTFYPLTCSSRFPTPTWEPDGILPTCVRGTCQNYKVFWSTLC